MKRYSILFFILFVVTKINAQNTLAGKISSITNEPLTGATIQIPDFNCSTIANKQGEYILKNLPEGNIKMIFSFIGYKTVIETVKIVKGENKTDISLKPSFVQTEEIVVTGGSVSSQHDNAVKIDIARGNDMLFSGTPNLMESLTFVPGVDMISKGMGISKPVIRGLSMNDVLVLNNGVRIENYQFSENHPLGIDDNNIDRVEIIKGPASMLYGSDAIGGVLNFIKESPAPINKLVGEYHTQFFSNTLGVTNSLGLKGASKHFFGGVRATNKSHSDYKQGGGTFVPNSRFNEWAFNANAGYTGKRSLFKINYDYFGQKLGMSVPAVVPIITEQGRKTKIWYQDLEHHLVSSQNRILFGQFKWETNIAWQTALRKLRTTIADPAVEMRLNTLTYDSKLYFPSSNNAEYIIGIQGMSQTNRNQHNRVSQFLPDANVDNIGTMALAQYTFFSKLKLQAGVRYDTYRTKAYSMGTEGTANYHASFSKRFTSFNASLGATYSLTNQIILRTNFAKAYRVPNLSELTSNGLHGNRYELGNNALTPQNAYEADASMHYNGEYISFEIAGFYNYIDNYIYISPTGNKNANGLLYYQFSQSNAKLFGGEARAEYRFKGLQWLSVEGAYSTVTGKQFNGNNLPFIPAQKVRAKLKAEKDRIGVLISPNVWFVALKAFNQDHPSLYETSTDGYTLCDAGINSGLRVCNQLVNLGLSINNIFDTKYYDHLSTLKAVNIYNPGRNISLTLTIHFGN
jgi:iron complex outermembrane recepter protein